MLTAFPLSDLKDFYKELLVGRILIYRDTFYNSEELDYKNTLMITDITCSESQPELNLDVPLFYLSVYKVYENEIEKCYTYFSQEDLEYLLIHNKTNDRRYSDWCLHLVPE